MWVSNSKYCNAFDQGIIDMNRNGNFCTGTWVSKVIAKTKVGAVLNSKKIPCFDQEIINMNRNGNSTNFFSYVCNGKNIKELFASTLNGIPASVKCVSSMIVVLNAKFARSLAAHANKKTVRNEEARQECHVLLVKKHWRLTFIAVSAVQAKTSLLYTFQRSMQANRNINLW